MTRINSVNDIETTRQKRNLTESQKRSADATKEGVVINSFVKDVDMHDLYDSMVISDSAKLPQKINEDKNSKEKSIMPISLIATGVMGVMALLSLFVKKNAKVIAEIDVAKKVQAMPRNLSINEETHQAIFQMVQCPNKKTIMAGVGVLTISAMAFMGEMFMNGFKDVWVKKKEADIQKNLQENLIAVETQSFSGKIQIQRSMLADKAREFSEYLCAKVESPVAFKKMMSGDRAFFTGRHTEPVVTSKQKKENNLKYFILGATTLGAVVGFAFIALKNLGKSKQYLEKYIKGSKDEISKLISSSSIETKENDKKILTNMFQSIDAEPKYIRDELNKLPWQVDEKNKFTEDVLFEVQKSTAQADKALGGDGPPKPTFYSHVNDYRAFLYNYLLDTKNPQFKQLFFGITGITALSYGGSVLGEAVKDVQVKKMNATTELDLQQRLVSTELRNFKAKKDTAINPLCDEFYAQLKKGKPKSEMKTIAENILFEVKNGPPFVYS